MKETNDGKKGGLLDGEKHTNGGIKAVVTDTGAPVELEAGEIIINSEASKLHWKALNEINQSAGDGVPIAKPVGGVAKKGGTIQKQAYIGEIGGNTGGLGEPHTNKGWFKNPHDSKWRFEINDSEMELLLPFDRLADYVKSNKTELNYAYKISRVLSHPELFKYYPFIKDILVNFVYDEKSDSPASLLTYKSQKTAILKYNFYGEERFFRLSEDSSESSVRSRSRKNFFIHEIQHIIQIREEMGGGSTVHGQFEQILLEQKLDEKTISQKERDILWAKAIKRNKNSSGEIESKDVENRLEYTDEQRKYIEPLSSISVDKKYLNMHKEDNIFALGGSITNTELDKAMSDLHRAEKSQATMKSANAIIRSKKNVQARLEALDLSPDQAAKLQTPDFANRIGFPTYALTNNNANIKRLQDRVNMLEKKLEGAKAVSEGKDEKYTFEGGEIEVNYALDRVQILFPGGRVEKELFQKLRKNGYVYSPTNLAFQRKITPQAISNAIHLFGAKRIGDVAPVEDKELNYDKMLETRNFTYVSGNIYNAIDKDYTGDNTFNLVFFDLVRENIVSSIKEYFKKHLPGIDTEKISINVYPKTYVREANFLFGKGAYLPSTNPPKVVLGSLYQNVKNYFALKNDSAARFEEETTAPDDIIHSPAEVISEKILPSTKSTIADQLNASYGKATIEQYLVDMPSVVQKLWGYLKKQEGSTSTGMDVKYDNKYVTDFFHYAYRALKGAQYGDNAMDYKALFIKKYGQQSLDAIADMLDQYRMTLKNGAFLAISTNQFSGAITRIIFHFPQVFSGIETNATFYEAAKAKPESERNSGEVMVIEDVEKLLAPKSEAINQPEYSSKEIYQMTFDEFLSNIQLRDNSFGKEKQVEIIRYFPDQHTEVIGSISNTDSEDKTNPYVRLQLEKFHWNQCFNAVTSGKKVPKENIDFYNSTESLLNEETGSAGFNIEKNIAKEPETMQENKGLTVVRDKYYVNRSGGFQEVEKFEEIRFAGFTFFVFKDSFKQYGLAEDTTGQFAGQPKDNKEEAIEAAMEILNKNREKLPLAIEKAKLSPRYDLESLPFEEVQYNKIKQYIEDKDFQKVLGLISNKENKTSRKIYSQLSGYPVKSTTTVKELESSLYSIYGYDIEAERKQDVAKKEEAKKETDKAHWEGVASKYPFLNLEGVTPMELGRIQTYLDKKWRFDEGVMSMGEYFNKHKTRYVSKTIRLNKYTAKGEERATPVMEYRLLDVTGSIRDVPKIIYDSFIVSTEGLAEVVEKVKQYREIAIDKELEAAESRYTGYEAHRKQLREKYNAGQTADWQLTDEEAMAGNVFVQGDLNNRAFAIFQAMIEGLPVPEKVLAQYGRLKKSKYVGDNINAVKEEAKTELDKYKLSWNDAERDVWDALLSKGKGVAIKSKKQAEIDYKNLLAQDLIVMWDDAIKTTNKADDLMLKQPTEKTRTSFREVKEGDYVEVHAYTTEAGKVTKIDQGKVTFKYGNHYLNLDNDSQRKYTYSNTYYVVPEVVEAVVEPKDDDVTKLTDEKLVSYLRMLKIKAAGPVFGYEKRQQMINDIEAEIKKRKEISKPKTTQALELANEALTWLKRNAIEVPSKESANKDHTVYLTWPDKNIKMVIDYGSPVADGLFVSKNSVGQNFKISELEKALNKIKDIFAKSSVPATDTPQNVSQQPTLKEYHDKIATAGEEKFIPNLPVKEAGYTKEEIEDHVTLSFYKSLIGKTIKQGTGGYTRTGKVIDVEVKNGGKISNTGIFLYFLEHNESVAEEIKVSKYEIKNFVDAIIPDTKYEAQTEPLQTQPYEVVGSNGVIKWKDKESADKYLKGTTIEIGYSTSYMSDKYTSITLGEVLPSGWYSSTQRSGQGNKLPLKPLTESILLSYKNADLEENEGEAGISSETITTPTQTADEDLSDIDTTWSADKGIKMKEFFFANVEAIRQKFDIEEYNIGSNLKLNVSFGNNGGYGDLDLSRNAQAQNYSPNAYAQILLLSKYIRDNYATTGEEDKVESRESFFNLPHATTLEELDNNINEILLQYSGRSMANLQIQSYLFEMAELGKEWLSSKNLSTKPEYDKYISLKHAKVRAGKGQERKAVLEEIKQQKGDKFIDEITKMAHEASDNMDRQISDSDDQEILARYPKLTKQQVKDTAIKVEKILTQPSTTEADKYILEQYEGFGSQTHLNLTKEEQKGLLHQFYTPYIFVKKMMDIAVKYGFPKGGTILEPSMGTGRFFKYAPEGSSYIGFDPDKKNIEIAKRLYPDATIYNEAFETAFLEKPRLNKMLKKSWLPEIDLVIGNPPYGAYEGYYKSYMPSIFKRFEFLFIYLGLKLLKKDGLLVFIVSQNFMNNGAMYNGMKAKILEISEFVDAVRLPNGIFSTTDVGTDIIVFRKK